MTLGDDGRVKGSAGSDTSRPALVQSVDRALVILEMLATSGDLGVTEISRTLDVHKSTVSRLVATLEEHGLVEQITDRDRGRGRYQLGLGVVRLAGSARARLDLVTESRPITRALAVETGETVNVVIRSGLECLYLDQASSSSALQIDNWLGKRNPLHSTANGRVLLAGLAVPDRELLLDLLLDEEGRFPAHTAATVTDPVALRDVLDAVRTRGYAIVVDELELGLTAIAAPVQAPDGRVIASVSLSGPGFRLTPRRLDDVVGPLRRAAAEIAQRVVDA